MPVRYCGYNRYLNQYIVAYDIFDGFLEEMKTCLSSELQDILEYPRYYLPKRYRAGAGPNSVLPKDHLPNTPLPYLKYMLIDLLKGMSKMLDCGVYSSYFGSSFGYVWVNGKLRILMVDTLLDVNDPDWTIANDGLCNFGDVVVKFLFRGLEKWSDLNLFMECFDPNISYHKNKIKMIFKHPFLMMDAKKVIEIFPYIHHCTESGDYGGKRDVNVQLLEEALNDSRFCSQICETTQVGENLEYSWSTDITNTIAVFLRSTPNVPYPIPSTTSSNDILYYCTSMISLIKLLRDIYEHYYPKKNLKPYQLRMAQEGYKKNRVSQMDAVLVYMEIRKNWPRLIHMIHQVLYCGDLFYRGVVVGR